jgi:ribosome-associated protein
MPDATLLQINSAVSVPLAELSYRATRSGGPGGQHVNTSSTRVELWWDVAATPSLTPEQRARVLSRLATRIGTDGRLRLVSSGTRSQLQNKEEVTERFREILARALMVPKTRRRTQPTKASRERRLEHKKRRGETKLHRRRPPVDD